MKPNHESVGSKKLLPFDRSAGGMVGKNGLDDGCLVVVDAVGGDCVAIGLDILTWLIEFSGRCSV